MNCQKCKSERILEISAKVSDMGHYRIGEHEKDGGYVPADLEIGGDDYLEINVCLDCGQHQGNFPVPPAEIEQQQGDDGVRDD